MALELSISKFGRTFATSYSRVRSSFGTLDSTGGGNQHIQIDVYPDKAARDADVGGDNVIATLEYSVSGEDFATYFGIDVLNEKTKNPYSQAYVYLKALDPNTIPMSGAVYPNFKTARDV